MKEETIYVQIEHVSSSGGQRLTDDRWSDREDEHNHYKVSAVWKNHNRGESVSCFGENLKDACYLVLVTYSTGNTFGRSFGHLDCPIAFFDRDEAEECLTKSGLERKLKELTGSSYYPWEGYFERLEGIRVKKFTFED